MYEYECEICHKKFSHKHDSYAIRAIIQHVAKEHGLTKAEYTIQYVRHGDVPLCACGCGTPVEIEKGWNKWRKYYKDHKNKMSPTPEVIEKAKASKSLRLSDPNNDSIPENILEDALVKYRKHLLTLREIELTYGFDRRTFQRLWKLRGYSTQEELLSLANKSKGTSGTRRGAELRKLNEDFYIEVRNFIRSNSGRYTINDVNRHFGNKLTNSSLAKNLKNLYGESIFEDLVFGLKSLEELKFLEILRYYLGPINVRLGYRLEDVIYDSLIAKKILFEYDGHRFHGDGAVREGVVEHDKYKNKLARKKGYYIIRVSDKQSKRIITLIKIILCANLVLLKSKLSSFVKRLKTKMFGTSQ